MDLFNLNRKKRKTNWSWSEIDKLAPFVKLTPAEAKIYILRAERQMDIPTDIGTVDDSLKKEIFRRIYFKKKGWKIDPKKKR